MEGDHLKEVSIRSFPRVAKTKSKEKLTSFFDSAIVNIYGGDQPPLGHDRRTSMGGRTAKNRLPGSVRLTFCTLAPHNHIAGNSLPEIALVHSKYQLPHGS